ncbi:hypothetical protein [Streptomyces sp. NPDC056464]|uniref:hypothetical protein n=1 Tax=Streptomyces sp. NPDC056464 TaxID=3345828 RepID=UPI00368700C9
MVLAVGAGLLTWTPASAAAADEEEMPSVTLQAARMTTRPANLNAVDSSGYLSSPSSAEPSSVSTWVGNDGSTVADLPTPVAVNGGFGLERVKETNTYRIRHYATGEVVRVDLPITDAATKVFAENRLVTQRVVDGERTLHLLEIPEGGGLPTDRQVSGVLDDLERAAADDDGVFAHGAASDSRGGVLLYRPVGGDARRTALLDFATARLTYVPNGDFDGLFVQHLGSDKILFQTYEEDHEAYKNEPKRSYLYVIGRGQPDSPGTLIGQLPDDDDSFKGDGQGDTARVVGDWLVYTDLHGGTVHAVPLAGGALRTLLLSSANSFVRGQDGSLYIEGGSDKEHWAVQRITLADDGTPVAKPAVPLPPVTEWEVGGMALDHGRLLFATESAEKPGEGNTFLTASKLSLAADGTLTAGPPEVLGDLGYDVPDQEPYIDAMSAGWHQPCYKDCLRLTATGKSSVAHNVCGVGHVVAAAGPYRVVRPSDQKICPTGKGKQEVRDGDEVLSTGPRQPAALWESTLWTPGSKPGTVSAVSLPSLKPVRTQPVGATCVPKELQVVGRWIYWSCGPRGDAGVYDRATGRQIDVPSGYAQLADGYLVSQANATRKLLITYFPDAVPADRVGTSELGPLPSPVRTPQDRRGLFWAVDRFDGAVAYLDASGDVTVKWPRVRASPFAEPGPGTPYAWMPFDVALLVVALAYAITLKAFGRRPWSPFQRTVDSPGAAADSGGPSGAR